MQQAFGDRAPALLDYLLAARTRRRGRQRSCQSAGRHVYSHIRIDSASRSVGMRYWSLTNNLHSNS